MHDVMIRLRISSPKTVYLTLWDLNGKALPGLQKTYRFWFHTATVAGKETLNTFKDYDIGIKQAFADLGKHICCKTTLAQRYNAPLELRPSLIKYCFWDTKNNIMNLLQDSSLKDSHIPAAHSMTIKHDLYFDFA